MTATARRRLVGAAALTLATNVAINGLNYVFQVLAGRWQPPADFTSMQTFFSLWSMVMVPASPLLLLVTAAVARAHVTDDRGAIRYAIGKAARVIAIFAGGLVIMATIGGGRFDAYFARTTPVARVGLVLAIVISLYAQLGFAALLGLARFELYNLCMLTSILAKLVCCLAPLRLGMGVDGVMIGLALTNVLPGLIAAAALHRLIAGVPTTTGAGLARGSAVVAAVVGNIGLVVLTQIDLPYVTRHLPAEAQLGYAAAATLAKLLFQVPMAVAIAMFPLVSNAQPRAQRLRTLAASMGITAAIVAVGLAAESVMPSLALRLTFGAHYIPLAPLLPACARAAAPFAFVTVFIHYAIALQRRRFLWIVAALGACVVAVLYGWTPPLREMLWTLGAAGVAATVAGAVTLLAD